MISLALMIGIAMAAMAFTAVLMDFSLHAVGARIRLSRQLRWRSAGAGVVVGVICVVASGLQTAPLHAAPVILFCAIMAGLSLMDLRTAWAPDLMTGPLCLLAPFVAAALAGQAFGWGDLIQGMQIIGIAAILWIVQCYLGMRVMPPPDAIVLIIPVYLFGLSGELSAFYTSISILMLICLRISRFRAIFARPEVVADVESCATSADLATETSVTAIAIAGPVLLVTLALKTLIAG